MDKTSIVGDAVLHIQDLQMRAKKLEAEIAEFETSLSKAEEYQGSKRIPKWSNAAKAGNLVPKTITQVHYLGGSIIIDMFSTWPFGRIEVF